MSEHAPSGRSGHLPGKRGGHTLASQLIGTWRLVSREDRTAAGERRVDPGLGADPVALLVFDAAGNFAAQFMKRDRSSREVAPTTRAGVNNSSAVNGYDAYFGKYTVDEGSGSVRTTLEGSLSPEDVASVFTREMHVDGDILTIMLATTSAEGDAVIRTLIWNRSA